jgi:protein involved in polysaccharide export with SLBB domain
MANARNKQATLVRMVLILAGLLQWNAPAAHAHSFSSPVQENYRIAPGDTIDVQVEDAPELSMTYRVNASGTFLMRFLGSITAQHRTQKELADVIADGLKGRYLKDPKVSVRLTRASAQLRNLLGPINHYYFIQGAVRNPGAYLIEGRASLSRLIDLAGGLTDTHGPIAYIMRKGADKGTGTDRRDNAEPEYETTTVNIDRLSKGAISEEVTLQRGDVVNIAVADIFFVAGEVARPGSFPFKQGMTLRQAIVLAGGVTVNALTKRGVIFRENPTTGKRFEINVDLAAVLGGKSKDVAIQPNDIIAVPSSRVKIMDRLRFWDSPPIPHLTPCRRSGPCIARLNWNRTARHLPTRLCLVCAVAADGRARCELLSYPNGSGSPYFISRSFFALSPLRKSCKIVARCFV